MWWVWQIRAAAQAFMYQIWYDTRSVQQKQWQYFYAADMFVKDNIEDVEQNIDRAYHIGKAYFRKYWKRCKSI